MNKKLSITAIIFLIIGCAGSTQRIGFDMYLDQIERPKDAKERFGGVNTTTVDTLGRKYLVFEDNLIQVMFSFGYEQIGIMLKNKSNHTMKVNWDNAAWISPSGESMRIIHSGVRLLDRNSPQSPSVIVRNGKLTDSILPADHVYFSNGQYGGWQYLALLHQTSVTATDMNLELQKAQKYVGKTCGVLLPIDIQGVQNDYIFTFRIGDATIVSRY